MCNNSVFIIQFINTAKLFNENSEVDLIFVVPCLEKIINHMISAPLMTAEYPLQKLSKA